MRALSLRSPEKARSIFDQMPFRSTNIKIRLVPAVRTDPVCLKPAGHNPNAHISRITNVVVVGTVGRRQNKFCQILGWMHWLIVVRFVGLACCEEEYSTYLSSSPLHAEVLARSMPWTDACMLHSSSFAIKLFQPINSVRRNISAGATRLSDRARVFVARTHVLFLLLFFVVCLIVGGLLKQV